MFVHPEIWSKAYPDWIIVEQKREANLTLIASVRLRINSGKWISMNSQSLEFSFSTEVITGWRAWKIVDFERRGSISEKRLQALGTSPIWEPYQSNIATCTTDGTHEAPWPSCRCGFWAFKTREHVERSLFETYGGERGKVIGQIALWGRVLECTRGFRGEYAYPQTLQFVEVDKKTAADVAGRYGTPYSIVKHSDKLKCEGYVVATEYDYDRFYATIRYECGLEVRAEISRDFEGKRKLDYDNPPPCPEHTH